MIPASGSALKIREMSASDIGAVAALCDRELVLDRDAGALPAVLTRRAHTGLLAVDGDTTLGACIGSVAESGEGKTGFADLLVVDRSRQRTGVGRTLLAALERRLAERGCERIRISGNAPYFAWPGIDLHYTAAVCFAEDLGYRRQRCEVNMDVDLRRALLDTAAAEARLRRGGIEIRRAAAADDGPLQESLAAIWQPDWVGELTAVLRSEHAGLHVACRGQQYVGFCAYGLNRLYQVGPVGTDPGLRGLGIGSVLLKRCLAEQRECGLTTAELVWAGPLSYFSNALGATIGRVFWQYEKDLTGRDTKPGWRDRIGLI